MYHFSLLRILGDTDSPKLKFSSLVQTLESTLYVTFTVKTSYRHITIFMNHILPPKPFYMVHIFFCPSRRILLPFWTDSWLLAWLEVEREVSFPGRLSFPPATEIVYRTVKIMLGLLQPICC